MKVHSNNDYIFLGRNAGSRLREEINTAKHSLKIISPYLTPSYVKDILKLAEKGVKVTLITANEVETDKSGNYSDLSHTDIVRQKRITNEKAREKRNKGMMISGLVFIPLIALIIFLSQYWIYFGIVLVINAIIFWRFKEIRIYAYEYYSPIRIKVIPDEYYIKKHLGRTNLKGLHLVHAKTYVIDDKIAYVGSVNFTYKAFKSNYETLVRVQNTNAVKEISREVSRLFLDKELYSLSLEEWGKKLYPEPPN